MYLLLISVPHFYYFNCSPLLETFNFYLSESIFYVMQVYTASNVRDDTSYIYSIFISLFIFIICSIITRKGEHLYLTNIFCYYLQEGET